MIDTHTHIYSKDFETDFNDIIERARKVGVKKVLLPNIDIESIESLHAMINKYPDFCLPMMGLHPTSVDKNWKEDLAVIKEIILAHKYKYVAIGEIGIDLYWDRNHDIEQKLAFEEQLRWAIEFDLPVSLHSRNAVQEAARCIRTVGAEKLRGVFHSFCGNSDDLRKVLELENFLIGVNGVITFKNSTLPTVLKETDLSRIIIETDAPYLTPMPYRGKRNEPSFIPVIVTKLAEIFGTTSEDVLSITTENAEKLFKLEN